MTEAESTHKPAVPWNYMMVFRSRSRFSFLMGCAAVLGLLACVALAFIFHFPWTVSLTYYFIMRPPFVWFGMTAPFLAAGFLGLKWRYAFAVGAIGFACYLTTDDAWRVLRPFEQRASDRFLAHQAFFYDSAEEAPSEGTVEIPLRILSWNAQSGNRGATELLREMATLHPDVVLIQEFAWGGDRKMMTAFDELPEFSGYYHDWTGSVGIISRFRVEEIVREDLPDWQHSIWKLEVTPGRHVTFVNVHLPATKIRTQLVRGFKWKKLGQAAAEGRQTLANLNKTLQALEGPVVLGGDFNLPPFHPELNRATRGWKECFNTGGFGLGKTVPAKLSVMRVDMIFVPEKSRVFRARAIPTRNSDHFGMLAEVEIMHPRASPPQ